MFYNNQKPTEDEIIHNSKTDVLYTTNFKDGKYFQVVFKNETGFGVQIAPRTMFKVLYIKNKNDITSFEIIKCTKKSEKAEFEDKQKVTLSKFNFSQLIAFLKLISELDLKGITEGKISLASDELGELDEETKKKIKTLLSKENGADLIQELLNNGNLASKDIVNTGYRKKQLEIFRKLLKENYLDTYKNSEAQKYLEVEKPPINTNSKNEKVWQYFFEKNPWIFGYGLDYIYCDNILNKKLEQVVSGFDFNEKGKRVDALMATMSKIQQFVLVEIKLPDTNLVDRSPRVGCWSVSNSVVDGIAQIQKTEMKLKERVFSKAEIKDDEGNFTGQIIYNYTPKSYLIIGNLSKFCDKNGVIINEDKYSSFQLFRKSNINPEIITYDELYERARFIVNQ